MGAFDVVVLGGGTAGVHVATEVAGGGKAVALVEAGLIGGESPYLACLPSNSLLLSAARGQTWEGAVARRTEVTGGLDDSGPARRLNRAGVTVIRGTGRITAPGTVEVTLGPARTGGPGAGNTVSLTYWDLVIATGCEPVAPPIEGLSVIPAWTTAESLCSPDLPRRLIVLGGGPAGCELTQIYASFGSQVTLVEAEPTLLPGEPAFAGRDPGGGAAPGRRGDLPRLPGHQGGTHPDGLTLALADGTRIDAERLLLASGRRPRLAGLGLDALGLQITPGMALPTTTRWRWPGYRAGPGRRATSPAPRTPTPAATRPAWSRRTSAASAARPTTARSRAACSPRLPCSRSASSRAAAAADQDEAAEDAAAAGLVDASPIDAALSTPAHTHHPPPFPLSPRAPVVADPVTVGPALAGKSARITGSRIWRKDTPDAADREGSGGGGDHSGPPGRADPPGREGRRAMAEAESAAHPARG